MAFVAAYIHELLLELSPLCAGARVDYLPGKTPIRRSSFLSPVLRKSYPIGSEALRLVLLRDVPVLGWLVSD